VSVQERKTRTTRAAQTDPGVQTPSDEARRRHAEILAGLDELLDEIDEVLDETEAEKFVSAYVQEGGQ
jgi:ubiquitin-like protein Pup